MVVKLVMKVGDRVKHRHDFLSDGHIKEILKGWGGSICYVIKLDEKAPNEYAWETDEILAFPNDIEVINN